jgi:hypothetical protein
VVVADGVIHDPTVPARWNAHDFSARAAGELCVDGANLLYQSASIIAIKLHAMVGVAGRVGPTPNVLTTTLIDCHPKNRVHSRELIAGVQGIIFRSIAATLIDFGRPGAVVRLGSF